LEHNQASQKDTNCDLRDKNAGVKAIEQNEVRNHLGIGRGGAVPGCIKVLHKINHVDRVFRLASSIK
jgi:hypothetical protein